MADKIILDKNVITGISRGNTAAARELNGYLKSGRKVTIAKVAYRELVEDSPTPKMRGQYRELIKDLRIPIDEAGSMETRVDVYANNIQFKTIPGANRSEKSTKPMDEYGNAKTNPPKQGDVFIAAQAKAANAKLWTLDDGLRRSARAQGIDVVESPIIKSSAVENPDFARQALGLNPKMIAPDGKVSSAPVPKGGPTGVYAIEGVADNTVPEFVPPSAKGEAIAGGAIILFQLINYFGNKMNDKAQQKRMQDVFAMERADIESELSRNQQNGVLVVFYFFQVDASPDSLLQPSATFNRLRWIGGRTIDEARHAMSERADLSEAPGPGRYQFSQEQWVHALHRSPTTTAKCPFRPYATGRFWVGNTSKAKFQLVDFNAIGGFDDTQELSVELAQNYNADFVILSPPSEVFWWNQNGKHSNDVPIKDAKTGNGYSIKVVDLDAWTPFNAKAAMVFPRTEWTEDFFNNVAPTGSFQLLSQYVNFDMIRWVRPENIELVKIL